MLARSASSAALRRQRRGCGSSRQRRNAVGAISPCRPRRSPCSAPTASRQLELRLVLGLGKIELSTLVFSDVEGEPLKPHTISRAWQRVVVAKGLPRVTFHALRHTHAIMLIRRVWIFSPLAVASVTARRRSPSTFTAT